MDTTFAEPTVITDTYEIVAYDGLFYVTRNGQDLTDHRGDSRSFISRNAARKRISRERSGNFHG